MHGYPDAAFQAGGLANAEAWWDHVCPLEKGLVASGLAWSGGVSRRAGRMPGAFTWREEGGESSEGFLSRGASDADYIAIVYKLSQ